MRQIQFRQGDVYLEQIKSLPSNLQIKEPDLPGKIVLAYGEATGHHHSIEVTEAIGSFVEFVRVSVIVAPVPLLVGGVMFGTEALLHV